jgi:hypothetical protein
MHRFGRVRPTELQIPGEPAHDDPSQRARVIARVAQVIDYVFFVVYGLLGLRFALALLAARSSAGFVRLIVYLTDPFYEPFKGIVGSPRLDSGHTFAVPLLIAVGVYGLLHLAIRGLLRLLAHPRTDV